MSEGKVRALLRARLLDDLSFGALGVIEDNDDLFEWSSPSESWLRRPPTRRSSPRTSRHSRH